MNGIEKILYPKHKQNNKSKINITNIGQLLLIVFLFVVICMQTAGIIDEPKDTFSLADEAPVEININSPRSADEISINTDINIKNHIPEFLFILGEDNGKLAVFSPDRETVYETFDVYVNTLPDYDKNLLLDGIKINTSEELYSLLEDYCS